MTGGCAQLAPNEAALLLAIANSFSLHIQSSATILVFIVEQQNKVHSVEERGLHRIMLEKIKKGFLKYEIYIYRQIVNFFHIFLKTLILIYTNVKFFQRYFTSDYISTLTLHINWWSC